jgi:hypothetical protein
MVYQLFRTILVLTCQTTLYCNPEDHKMNYLVSLQKAICLFTCLLVLRMLILWRKYLLLFQCSFSLCFGMKSSTRAHYHIFHLCNVSSVYLFLQGHYSISPLSFVTSCQYHLFTCFYRDIILSHHIICHFLPPCLLYKI